jgi:hypothetical protein
VIEKENIQSRDHWELFPLEDQERRILEDCISWIRFTDGFANQSFETGYKGDFVLTEEDNRVLSDLCSKINMFLRYYIRRHCKGMIVTAGWDCGIWDTVFASPPGNIPHTLIVEGNLNLHLTYSYTRFPSIGSYP